MSKFFSIRVLFTLLALVPFLQSCEGDVYETMPEEVKTYIASGHPDWPPIMFQSEEDATVIAGAGPAIALMIFNELGLNLESRFVGTWDIVQEKAESGEIDLIVAAYKTPEREIYMDYSIPYTEDPVSIFVKKGGEFPFESWDELIGKRGVVTRGDSYGQEFDDFIIQNLDVIIVDSPDEAFALVISGDVDYFVYALYSGENSLKKSGELSAQISILPNYVCAEDFYMTVSKRSRLVEYLPRINEILQRLIDEGVVERLIAENK